MDRPSTVHVLRGGWNYVVCYSVSLEGPSPTIHQFCDLATFSFSVCKMGT